MKKLYTLMFCVLAFIGIATAQTQDRGNVYEGSLSIQLGDGEPIPLDNQAVYIKDNGNGLSTFGLYEFTMDPSMGSMGDIVIEDVKTTKEGDNKTYDGVADKITLSMMGTPINASATIKGTEKPNGELTMNIAVLWLDETGNPILPITVIFTGKLKNGGASDLIADNATVYGTNGSITVAGFNGVANVYSISGQLVKSAKVANNASIEMPVGIYFVRTGAVATKVIVK